MSFLLALALPVIAVARVILLGWESESQDDGRYLFVGLSVLDGRGPTSEGGALYLTRSPVYPTLLAFPGRLAGVDPATGGHIAAMAIAVVGMLAAVVVASLIAGQRGALLTAAALAADPFLWWMVPTMAIDLPHAAVLLVVVLLMSRPTLGRWLGAGALVAVAILIKESVALAVLLPIAWLGAIPPRRLIGLAVPFAAVVVLGAAWWWLLVWSESGTFFPLAHLSRIAARDFPSPVSLDRIIAQRPAALAIGVAGCLGWVYLLARYRSHPTVRLLAIAAAALLPAAALAYLNGLHARQYAGLLLLSSVAFGAAVAGLVDTAAPLLDVRRGARVLLPRRARDALSAVAIVAVIGVAQLSVPMPQRSGLLESVAAVLRPRIAPGDAVVASFNESSLLAVQLYGQAKVRIAPVRRVGDDAPADILWLGSRGPHVLAVLREPWGTRVGAPDVRFLVLIGPDAYTPDELRKAIEVAGPSTGFTLLATLSEPAGRTAWIYEVDSRVAGREAAVFPLTASAAAVNAWLRANDDASLAEQLAATTPLVSGSHASLQALAAELGSAGCLMPAGDGYGQDVRRLVPAAACGDEAMGIAPA